MELASMFFGFIIALYAYRQLGLNYRYGIIGWFTVFWGFWIVGALISFFILIIAGFLARWILIGILILFIISLFKKNA